MPEMPSDQEVADVLEAVRRALGISVREQARRAGVSPTTMSRWCSGKPLEHPMAQLRPKALRYLATAAEMDARAPGEKRARALAGEFVERIEAALTSTAGSPDVDTGLGRGGGGATGTDPDPPNGDGPE